MLFGDNMIHLTEEITHQSQTIRILLHANVATKLLRKFIYFIYSELVGIKKDLANL